MQTSRSTFDLDATLRRLKPEKRRSPLRRRDALRFLPDDARPSDIGPVLLDTCVYIDSGKGKLPTGALRLLALGSVYHSSVSLAELSYALGRLDPDHPSTAGNATFFREVLSRIPDYRTVAPGAEAYVEAGIVTGTLTRTQGLQPPERRKLMFDALVFLTARHFGYTVLTANAHDFDLIHQLVPQGKILYYAPR